MAKLPGFMFYPGDWLKDLALRRCSKAAQGVWINMICLAFDSDERGIFITAAVAWTKEDIARAVGGDVAENLSMIDELLAKGVARIDKRNAIYCARMVRDEQKREKCSEAGKRGGGSPLLIPAFKGDPKGDLKGTPKGEVKGDLKGISENESESKEVSNLGKLSNNQGGVGGSGNGNGKHREYNPRPGFLRFKKIYPLFTNEFLTGQLWCQQVTSKEIEDAIFQCLEWFIPFYQKNKGMPHSHTFIRDFRWNDPNPEYLQEQADEERYASAERRFEEKKRASTERNKATGKVLR